METGSVSLRRRRGLASSTEVNVVAWGMIRAFPCSAEETGVTGANPGMGLKGKRGI